MRVTNTTSAWFLTGPARGAGGLKLFCFPYAGGTAQVFKKWAEFLPSSVQVIPVELPGRGGRLQESPFVRLPLLIEELTYAIWPLLDKPFIFFGHFFSTIIGAPIH